ncbi:MAG: sulfotransferase [Pseudomonadota bacterium]|nr:sulfotransferase [Pseudomonadota bacterium]
MSTPKILGIGLAKTGTTSLNDAFAILDITSIGCPVNIASIKRFEAATDGIVADQFEALDRAFPGSKFIYTARDRDSWLNSYTRYHGRKKSSLPGHAEVTRRLYGTTGTERGILLDAFERHEQHVFEYFRDRPDDLLIIDIVGGRADWETLCRFLGKPVPAAPFPASNPKFTDNIFRHLLFYLKDPVVVSEITRAPVDFLNTLSIENYLPTELLEEEPTKRGDRILVKSCKHFGGVSRAADKLHLETDYLEAAIKRHKERKALRQKRKSTVLGKRLRKVKRLFNIR